MNSRLVLHPAGAAACVTRRLKPYFVFLALISVGTRLHAGGSQHDGYVVAAINSNFVVGSKLVNLSGLFQRTEEGSYRHFGLNFPFFFS